MRHMNFKQYDYTKVFFRRPIWTEGNVRILAFLIPIALVFLMLTFFSVRYYNSYPDYKIRSQIKQNYIARVIAQYANETPLQDFDSDQIDLASYGIDLSDLEAGDDDFVDAVSEAIREENAEESPIAGKPRVRKRTALAEEKKPEYDQSLSAFLRSPTQTSLHVQNAIQSIPNIISPSTSERFSPLQPYNTRKKAYESGTKQFTADAGGGKIDIASAEFTDYEIVKGIRNYEETITIAKNNQKFVKHCIDRAFRDDPTVRGNIEVKFNIHPEGYVLSESVRILRSDVKDVRVLKCIKRTIRRWRNFPRVKYENGEYVITQKYIF